nr:MAG TPA: hypothetical protein [Caudoviricetes sp.]
MQRRYVAQADPKQQRVDFYAPPVGQPFLVVPQFHEAAPLFPCRVPLFRDKAFDFRQPTLSVLCAR